MATNITQNTTPSLWSSANDDVKFTFAFKPLLMNGIGNDSGKAYITLFNVFDVTPTVGESIYIVSPLYNGTFKILEVSGTNTVTIDTPYLGTITVDTYFCYHLRVPLFTFYKGFDIAEGGTNFNTELPYTKVIDIKPSVLYNSITGLPYLEINLKGSVRYIFTITPLTANEVDFNAFNVVRLTWDGTQTVQNSDLSPARNYFFVLNSAITNTELNYYFTSSSVDAFDDPIGYKYLVPTDKPYIPSRGVAFFSAIVFYSEISGFEENLPIVYKFINGVKQ